MDVSFFSLAQSISPEAFLRALQRTGYERIYAHLKNSKDQLEKNVSFFAHNTKNSQLNTFVIINYGSLSLSTLAIVNFWTLMTLCWYSEGIANREPGQKSDINKAPFSSKNSKIRLFSSIAKNWLFWESNLNDEDVLYLWLILR